MSMMVMVSIVRKVFRVSVTAAVTTRQPVDSCYAHASAGDSGATSM